MLYSTNFCGGIGTIDHVDQLDNISFDALAVASVLHYEILEEYL